MVYFVRRVLFNLKNIGRSTKNEVLNNCPICNKTQCFSDGGTPPRSRALCMYCGSSERQRLMWIYLSKQTTIFQANDMKLLHVAPDNCFIKRFKKIFKKGYLTADLCNPRAMVKMDLTKVQYPDNSFDFIICNHVLEHIEDDQKAMREMYRVLKKDGEAFLTVPLFDLDKTFEDASMNTPALRKQAFGLEDHVRLYGRDFPERVNNAGFTVKAIRSEDILSADELMTYSCAERVIFHCTKLNMN